MKRHSTGFEVTPVTIAMKLRGRHISEEAGEEAALGLKSHIRRGGR